MTPADVAAFVTAAGRVAGAGVEAYGRVRAAVDAVAGARAAADLDALRAAYLSRAARAATRAQGAPAAPPGANAAPRDRDAS